MAEIDLKMHSGTGRDGELLHLPGRLFLMGRGAGCEVQVDSDVASREHAALALEDDGWVVRDRDSRNGTLLNGRRITLATLRPQDEIQLGPDGPIIRVVNLEPAAPAARKGEDPTRTFRMEGSPPSAGRSPGASPESTGEDEIPVAIPLPVPARPPVTVVPTPPQAKGNRRRGLPPILALLGVGFAATVAMGVLWTDFPYEPATAPILWCMAALRYVAPDAIPDPGTQLQVFRGLVMLYGLTAGVLLQRPIRRIVPLAAFAGFHVLAVLAL